MQLTIRNLTKSYPNGVRALRGIDLTIPPGMFGLLGPNGAGKSTLMRTIATLPERPRMHPIDDLAARNNTYIVSDSDWIEFKASVCTAPDQIAIAPGYLQKEWEQDGRRCFAYAMDAKILHFYSFLSARYEVLRDKHAGIDIEIYYQEGHEYNLARMVKGIKKSLDYFQANFSPYQFRQVRILEFPRYETFAQAFPNTVPFSESIGFIARVRDDDPEDLDYPFSAPARSCAATAWRSRRGTSPSAVHRQLTVKSVKHALICDLVYMPN